MLQGLVVDVYKGLEVEQISVTVYGLNLITQENHSKALYWPNTTCFAISGLERC